MANDLLNRGDQIIYSNFFITVTSNLSNTQANQRRFYEGTKDALRTTLSNANIWRLLMAVREDGSQYDTWEPAAKRLVRRVRARVALEANGTRNQSPHAHIFLEIAHSTNIRLRYNILKQFLRTYYRANRRFDVNTTNGFNIDIRFVRGDGNDQRYLLHYMLKTGTDAVGSELPTLGVTPALLGAREAYRPGNHVTARTPMDNALEDVIRTSNLRGGVPDDGTDELRGMVESEYT